MFNVQGEQTIMYFIVECVLFGLNSDHRAQIFLMSTMCIQDKEHISKCYFTPGSWSQLFLTLPLGSAWRSQAIYEVIYAAYILTVPIVYHFGHFVICKFINSITSKFFITSKLTQSICLTSKLLLNYTQKTTTKLRLNLLVTQQ